MISFFMHRENQSLHLSAEFSMSARGILGCHVSWMEGVQLAVLVWALPEVVHPTDSDDQLHLCPT